MKAVDHPTRALLAEVIVERPGGRQLRGSGYRVASEWVITADHVVAGAEKVGIWFGAPQELQDEAGVTVDPAKVLRAPWADLALLPIRSEHSQIDHPPLFGRLDRDVHEPVSARAAGFPWFKLRPAGRRSKVKLRELHEASGTIAAGSNAKTRTYELTQLNLVPREHPEPFKHSPWEGMSGAAVWAGSRLIGVIGQHHPGEGLATLTVRPIEELFGSDSLAQVSEWREALWRRLPPRAADLWLATPLDWRGHVLKHARDIAADLAPERLDDRESTLADLHGFSDSGRWRWVQGEAFAGKTALLAWFTLHARCSVVSCFLRRTTGDNTAGYALDTMSEQLAALSGGASYQPPAYLSGKRQEFSRLLADAARACDERGRRLLILLDGLDEYDSSSGLQLRDWLPHREESMPHNVALLVASRKEANIELPDDHPLRRHVKLLPPSMIAGKLRETAREELRQTLAHPGTLEYPIVGFLAAARGALTTDDLRALLKRAGRQAYGAEIDTVMRRSLDRTLGHSHGHDGVEFHAFAHEALLSAAQDAFTNDLREFADTLSGWVQSFEELRWPHDTPAYALIHYPRDLQRREPQNKLFDLLEDEAWSDRLSQFDPTWSSNLDAIDTVWRAAEVGNESAVESGAPLPWLGMEIHCALIVASIRSLSSGVGRSLLAALVSCGYWTPEQALRVATQSANAEDRAYLLGDLVQVKRLDEPLLTIVVRTALSSIQDIPDKLRRTWALQAIAKSIPGPLIEDALQMARSLPAKLRDGPRCRTIALAPLLARAAALGRAAKALDEALALPNEDDRAQVLAELGAQLPSNLVKRALDAARAMGSHESSAEALAGLVNKDVTAGEGVLREAFDAALRIKDADRKSWVLCVLAPYLPAASVDEALAAARRDLSNGNLWRLQTALAKCLGALGQWPRALDIAREQENRSWRVRALVAVAESVPEDERTALDGEMLDAVWSENKILLPGQVGIVAPYFNEPQLRMVIESALSSNYAADVGALLSQLAKLGRPQEAFELALRTATWNDERSSFSEPSVVRVWAALAPKLSKPLQDRACSQALAAAHRIGDDRSRVSAIAAYLLPLPDDVFHDALRSLRSINGPQRGELLLRLLPRLPEHLLINALEAAEALPAGKKFRGKAFSSRRADVLIELAGRLQEPQRSLALNKAEEAIACIDYSLERAKVSARLARYLPKPPHLPDDVLREVIHSAEVGHGRSAAISAIRPYVTAETVKRLTEAVRAEDDKLCKMVRRALEQAEAPGLAGESKSRLLDAAFRHARSIEDFHKRATSMALLVPHLSILLRSEIKNHKGDWRSTDGWQTDVLVNVGPHLPPEQLREALSLALRLSDEHGERFSAIRALAPLLAQLSPVDLYSLWRTTLRALSMARRVDLLRHLEALSPLVVRLGGEKAAIRTTKAIELCGEWWP